MDKKGTLQELYPAIMILVLVGVLIGVGIMVLGEISETSEKEDTYNQTFTAANDTNVSLNFNDLESFNSAKVYNASNISQLVFSGNYTVHLKEGYFELHENASGSYECNTGADAADWGCVLFSGESVHIEFVYMKGMDSTSAINETSSAIGDFSGWLSIIIVIIAAAIILGIIFKSFVFGRRVV